MLNKLFLVLFVSILSAAAMGQTSYVDGYSTVSYDSTTNTVTGYSYTLPSYVNAVYYRAGDQAQLLDFAGTQLDSDNVQIGGGSAAQVNLSATGSGCQYYQMSSLHYEILYYYVNNYYINGFPYTGYYDPYDYNYYEGQPYTTYWPDYEWFGSGPQGVISSTDLILGGTEEWSDGTCNTGPKIRQMFPNYGAPGASNQLAVIGNGFTGTSTVELDIPQKGITISGVQYLNPQNLVFTITIDGDKAAGSFGMHVQNGASSSNSANFSIRIPHHLQVVGDVVNTRQPGPDCLTTPRPNERDITLDVVDSSGNPVGPVQVQEHFNTVSTNSCLTSGLGPNPSSCHYTDGSRNRFTDGIAVNCGYLFSGCGYTIQYEWQWCPPGRTGAPFNIGYFDETVHSNSITVNGNSTALPTGTPINP